ncbi:MAG: type II toxin-antitoxin system VapC family toxin [Thermoleophilia bacterium]|nr:type II toxin-antitoxin system VapC family toxin [Thermoleophilia bacterium]
MIAYVESSAAAKILFRETETEALKRYLDALDADDAMITSSVVMETELRRAAVREEVSQALVTDILDHFDLVEPDRSVYREAGLLPGQNLRTLDALHVAIALRVGADVMVSYDQRQIVAAQAAGLHTISPQ